MLGSKLFQPGVVSSPGLHFFITLAGQIDCFNSLLEVAGSLCVGDNLIRRWKWEFEEEASGARLNAEEREGLKRLRKEVRLCPISPRQN